MPVRAAKLNFGLIGELLYASRAEVVCKDGTGLSWERDGIAAASHLPTLGSSPGRLKVGASWTA